MGAANHGRGEEIACKVNRRSPISFLLFSLFFFSFIVFLHGWTPRWLGGLHCCLAASTSGVWGFTKWNLHVLLVSALGLLLLPRSLNLRSWSGLWDRDHVQRLELSPELLTVDVASNSKGNFICTFLSVKFSLVVEFFFCSKLFKTKQFNLMLIFASADLKPQIIIIVCQFTVNNKL